MGCCCVAADVGDVRQMMLQYRQDRFFVCENVQACREALSKKHEQSFKGQNRRVNPWSSEEVTSNVIRLFSELHGNNDST
jgi:hypothetical protein